MKNKSKKRIVPILNYNVKSFKEYELISELSDTKKLVFNNLVAAIEESLNGNKKSASIFMIDFDHFISLNKDKWKNGLQRAIDFFSSPDVENYEMCQKCLELIERIDPNVVEIESYEK